MIILELIKRSATILNVEEVLEDSNLDGFESSEEATILTKNPTLNRMFELAKVVINEVLSYSPIISESVIASTGKKIFLTKLIRLDKIVSIKNEQGKAVKFRVANNNIHFDEDGNYTITYQQYPITDSMLYPIENFHGSVSDDALVAGLNSYYCLATGLYAEYNVYNAQYVDRLSRIRNLKVFSMPNRSWND